jgi:vitamin B12 transporter
MFSYPQKQRKEINSHKVLKVLSTFIFVFIIITNLSAQETPQYNLNEIVVTANRVPIPFADLTRSVTIIDSEQIRKAPVNSVQGLLQYAMGVDLRQRGVDGIQGDVGIRGGTFEETLIMIDGIKVNDPQTGHHDLNLPVSLDDIQRIEILKGPGSSIYGPDAFSGVINIITKKGNDESLDLNSEGGQNGYYNYGLYGAYPVGIVNNHISFSRERSNGYIHNTDFNLTNFTYGSSIKTGSGDVNLFFGYNDKKFGANSFYTTLFPDQWEHTTTKFLNATADLGDSTFSISPKIYWRRNDDDFLLEFGNPSFYQNIHQTNIYGAEIQSSLKTDLGTTSLGGEYTTDKIKSTNLGDHSRENKGIFAEQKFIPCGNFTFIVNAYAYDYATLGWKFWPGLQIGYNISKNVKLYGSVGKAFRIPTYTELYYSDPASQGNPNLKHEETLNYEAGVNFIGNFFYSRVSLFRKEGRNLIDWVRTSNSQPWTAENITSLNTNGIELSYHLYPDILIENLPITKFSIDYTYLNTDKNPSVFQSEYLLDYLRHQLLVSVSNNWWAGIYQSWDFRYENRINFGNHFVVDSQLMKNFEGLEVYLKATNLFNESYEEVQGIPMPGRWLFAGFKYVLNK